MRLLRLSIDGFGLFHDCQLPGPGEEFAPGLVVLSGPNESGKSTLLAFLRRVLHGYPDARSRENAYPPLAGGKHGGRVLVLDEAGKRLWIERSPGSKGGPVRIYEDGGQDLPPGALPSLVAHIPREIYQSVFTFALSDLTSLGALDAEGIRDRIYGAGLGTVVSPAKAAEDLAKWQAEILKSRGKARINDSAAALKGKQSQLRGLGDQQTTYERLCSDLADAQAEGSRLAAAVEERRQALLRTDRLREARPHFVDLRSAEEGLGQVPEQPFPHAGLERYDRAKEKINDARGDIDELDRELAAARRDLEGLRVDQALLDSAEAVERLHAALEKYQSAQEDLPKREAERAEAEHSLRDQLRDLGPEWTETKLSDFDPSIPVREEVRQWRERGEETRVALHDAGTRAEEARRAAQTAKEADDTASNDLQALPEPASREDIEQRRQAVRQLRVGAQQLRTADQQLASLSERLHDREEERRRLADGPVAIPALPKWPTWLLLAVGLVGACIAVASRSGSAWGGLFVATGLLLALAYHGLRRWLSGLQARDVSRREQRLAVVDQAISDLKDAQVRLVATRSDFVAKLQEPRAHLSLGDVPEPMEVERIEAGIENERADLERCERARAEVARAKKQLERAQDLQEQARQAHEQSLSARSSYERGWREWLQAASLATSLSPEGALEFLSKAESARAGLRRIEDLRHRIGGLGAIMNAYAQDVAAVLRATGRLEQAGAEAVDRLVMDLAAAREALVTRRTLEGSIEALQERRAILVKRCDEAEEERNSLFTTANVDDEEGFRSAAVRAAKRSSLEEEHRQALKLLETSLGSGAVLREALQELADIAPEVLASRADRLRGEVTELQEQAKAANEKVGELRTAIGGLATDDKASRLRSEIRSLEEDVVSDGERWAVVTLARTVLRRTQERYERERRPMVLEEAEAFFGEVTGGRYRLVSPVGETRLEVEESGGKRKALDELSRGTAEQLYLSLRFGYVRELARQGQLLPVVMDDVLVDSDPERARGAAKGIAKLADTHQVLLFTCHPETVDLLGQVAPQAQFYTLGVPRD
ncbi:MAG: AAA family ATPase [Armatimonadota bacterium]